jgi:hypothetical protein
MNRQSVASAVTILILTAALSPGTVGRAQEPADTQITVLAGEWKVTYTNDSVWVSVIDTEGKWSVVEPKEPKLKGQIKRKGAALLLEFEEDDRMERLTLGTDGRLFVEHYYKSEFLDGKKPRHIGIGVRQK